MCFPFDVLSMKVWPGESYLEFLQGFVLYPSVYLSVGRDAARLRPDLPSGVREELVQKPAGPAAQGSVCRRSLKNVDASAHCAAAAMRPFFSHLSASVSLNAQSPELVTKHG